MIIDALVAEKVMGWKWWRRINPITGQKWLARDVAPVASMVGEAIPCEPDSDLLPEAFDGPAYSTDIAAAWLVVEKMRERKAAFVLGSNGCANQWSAWFINGIWSLGRNQNDVPELGDPALLGCATASTASLAICGAALIACEVSV